MQITLKTIVIWAKLWPIFIVLWIASLLAPFLILKFIWGLVVALMVFLSPGSFLSLPIIKKVGVKWSHPTYNRVWGASEAVFFVLVWLIFGQFSPAIDVVAFAGLGTTLFIFNQFLRVSKSAKTLNKDGYEEEMAILQGFLFIAIIGLLTLIFI